jgi:hypothetical protein
MCMQKYSIVSIYMQLLWMWCCLSICFSACKNTLLCLSNITIKLCHVFPLEKTDFSSMCTKVMFFYTLMNKCALAMYIKNPGSTAPLHHEYPKILCVLKSKFLFNNSLYVCRYLYYKNQCALWYCHSHNNWGPRNSFQRLLVPVYFWKTVEKPETDPQLLWEWQYRLM